MNQELATRTTGTAVAMTGANPFEDFGNSVSQNRIVGDLLKFTKGDYFAGRDQNAREIAMGTRLLVNMDEALVGWLHWTDGKPDDMRLGRIAEGHRPCSRRELGDDDPTAWPKDDNGQPQDPWQNTFILVMKEEEGEQLFTFSTSSTGGRNAIAELCKVYGRLSRQRPDDFPVITLGVGKYQHSNKAYGWIKYPVFEVVGWAPKSEIAAAMSDEAGAAAAAAAPTDHSQTMF